jgi:urease accessory protein
MGGELPQNFLNGILSGIAHPIIGFDHLAFILTFGIITSYFKNKVILPLYFVTFSLMGTILSVNFLVVPFSELIISLSIIIAGLTSLYEKKINIYFPIILALGGGFFHGYAFGQSVVGIEASPLIAYLIGIALIGFVLIFGSSFLITKYYYLTLKPRFVGAIFTGVGLTYFIENIEALI